MYAIRGMSTRHFRTSPGLSAYAVDSLLEMSPSRFVSIDAQVQLLLVALMYASTSEHDHLQSPLVSYRAKLSLLAQYVLHSLLEMMPPWLVSTSLNVALPP